MTACTLDYKWYWYVVASLVSVFGGVIVLLPINVISRQVRESRKHGRRPNTANGVGHKLGYVRSGAQGILAGSSTINKAVVSPLFRLSV